MARTEPPANDLSGLEAHDNGEVAECIVILHECEVLCPGFSVDHAFITHAVLRTVVVFEARIVMQDILRSRYLCLRAPRILVLGCGSRDDNACLGSDSSGFVLAPAKVNSQPTNTVERMLCVYTTQLFDKQCVSCSQLRWRLIVATLANA